MEKENDKLNIFLHVDYEYPCKYSILTLHRPSRVFEDPFDEGDSIAEDYIIVNNDAYVRLIRSEYRKLLMGRFADDCSVDAYATYHEALERHLEESRKKDETKPAVEAVKNLVSNNPPGENGFVSTDIERTFADNPIKDQASDKDFEFDEDACDRLLSPVDAAKPDTDRIMNEVKDFILEYVKARNVYAAVAENVYKTIIGQFPDAIAKPMDMINAILEAAQYSAMTMADAADEITERADVCSNCMNGPKPGGCCVSCDNIEKACKLHNTDLKALRETVERQSEEYNVARVIRDALLENRNECRDTFTRAVRILDLVNGFIHADEVLFNFKNRNK